MSHFCFLIGNAGHCKTAGFKGVFDVQIYGIFKLVVNCELTVTEKEEEPKE